MRGVAALIVLALLLLALRSGALDQVVKSVKELADQLATEISTALEEYMLASFQNPPGKETPPPALLDLVGEFVESLVKLATALLLGLMVLGAALLLLRELLG